MVSRITKGRAGSLACGLLAAASSSTVFAQSPAQALLADSFVFNLGTFIVNSDITARLDGRSSQNPEVDFDRTFGKDVDATRVRLDGLWRINPAHHLRFMYFNNTRTASRVIDQEIKWGNHTFQVGGLVESEIKQDTSALIYEYAFSRSLDYELAATFGIHYSKTSLRLSGNATVTDANGNVSAAQASSRSDSVPAPLPVIGLRAAWAVSPSWHIDLEGQFFKINYEGINGNWSDVRVGATWMFNRNFGLGLGYNRWVTRADVGKNNFNGSLKVGYSGLQAYVTGSF